MKNMLLAAVTTGVAVAAIILYLDNRDRSASNQLKVAARNAYKTMNAGIGHVERSTNPSLS